MAQQAHTNRYVELTKHIKFGAIGIFAAMGGIILYLFDPAKWGIFPKCPFLVITGLQCPGCGSQRALHSILHGNIAAAFGYNPLVLFAVPYIILGIYLEYFGGARHFPRIYTLLFGKNAATIILITIISFWIMRNLI